MRRNAYVIFLFVVAVITTPLFGFAADDAGTLQQQIDARRSKANELQAQIDKLKQALAAKQKEKLSLQNQLGLIGGRMQKTKLGIDQTREQLKATELTLRQTTLTLEAQRSLLATQRARLSELLRTLSDTEHETTLTLLARGQTLSDFFVATDQLTDTQSELATVSATTNALVASLAQQQAAYEKTKRELATIDEKLTSQHSKLKEQSFEKAQLLLQTQESEAKFQKLVADLKKEYRATELEIEAIERRARKGKGGVALPTGSVAMQWPVPSHVVTAGFHDPDYPFRHVFEHPGADMRAQQGTPVRSAAAGVVARAKDAGKGYSYVLLVHSNTISTVYGHLSRIVVNEDDTVSAGDIIGYSGGMPGTRGAGPFVTGPHLHFEVRSQGIPVNPLDFLP